jgi:very-long-chain enoyl-CoA reductase
MLPVVHVPTHPVGYAIAAAQCLNLLSCVNEARAPAPYSRFAGDVAGFAVPSRTGMALIYAPAFALSAAAFASSPARNGREALVGGLLAVHFLKRCVEVAAVHKYSGKIAFATATAIGAFYALLSLLIVASQRSVPAYAPGPPRVGLGLFAVGELGNLYHHALLARQRRGGGAKYVVPTGGLFDACTMPHYLFEIVAWGGVAAASAHLHAYLVAAGMASYLAGRAVATTRWYEAKFGSDWPADRAHLVPGIF